jgi:hypothetical protein
VLYCTGRGTTGCFILDGTVTGPHRCLDTKGLKISVSQPDTNRCIVRTARLSTETEMISRKADGDKPIKLAMAHVVNV